MDAWHKRRIAELEARAPVKRTKPELYAVIKLKAAAKAFAAMKYPKAMVYIWLVHQARRTGKRTVSVPNGVLTKYGVPPQTKRRALKELAAAGVILLNQQPRKTPVATLL